MIIGLWFIFDANRIEERVMKYAKKGLNPPLVYEQKDQDKNNNDSKKATKYRNRGIGLTAIGIFLNILGAFCR